MALRRRACVFHAFAVRRRALFGALLTFISLSVLSPPSARSGESQPIDSSRIVSIGGAVTETIYALGLEGRIVGVDTTSLYPPEALKRAPNVGYMRRSVGRGNSVAQAFMGNRDRRLRSARCAQAGCRCGRSLDHGSR